ncbi:MAG TPA: hypothetical protein VF314_08605 [Actinomycetes bacterium]
MTDEWFYCLKHNTVEKGSGCANIDRMGPYATSEEAARAIEHARERTEEWDSDPKWKDDD